MGKLNLKFQLTSPISSWCRVVTKYRDKQP